MSTLPAGITAVDLRVDGGQSVVGRPRGTSSPEICSWPASPVGVAGGAGRPAPPTRLPPVPRCQLMSQVPSQVDLTLGGAETLMASVGIENVVRLPRNGAVRGRRRLRYGGTTSTCLNAGPCLPWTAWRSPSSMPWPAHCSWTRTNALTCSIWPGPPSRRAAPRGAARPSTSRPTSSGCSTP